MSALEPREAVRRALGTEPTPQQWAAISAPLEPAVLIAGAGSGKTAVMATRIVWLIASELAKPSQILGLTFTNKAAANLLERVRKAVAPLELPEGEEPTILTYHSFAASLIAEYGLRAGLEPGASLLTPSQAWQLCAEVFAARTFEELEVRSMYHVDSALHLSSECADHLVDPAEVIRYERDFLARVDEAGKKLARDILETSAERIELAEVVAEYRKRKRERHLLDYGDQIAVACEIAADPAVAEDFRSRFTVALLDEYQDTNHAQAQLLRRLMPVGYPVIAVGDPDQNIYAWRGASLQNLLGFAREFPVDDVGTPAHSMPLTVNFRSGSKILRLANSLIERIDEKRRPKDKVLDHFPARGEGEVVAMLLADQVEEAERLAAEARRAHDEGTPWAEIAILPRKKRLFAEIVEVFRNHEIPLEVIGLGGLMRTPEVTDLVSMLRVLDDPMRNVALARLIRGPRWRIGHRDLAQVARDAAARNRDLRDRIDDAFEGPGDVAFSLAEALQWVDEIEGLSDEARERIRDFNACLVALRARTTLPLAELVAEALDALGLARELRASPSPAAPSALRNLANFMDRVASFEPLDGEPTLGALIEWLDAIEESEEEIEASQPSDDDSVKLMTIHQAKGLEFDVVLLPGLAAGRGNARIFPDTARQPNPAVNPKYLPFHFRGDKEVLPAFMGNLKGFREELASRAMEEERRLLYVVVTRARKRFVATAAHWYYPSGWGEALRYPMGPSEFWNEIAEHEVTDVTERVDQPEENPLIGRRAKRAARWPLPAKPEPDPLFPEGLAAAVEAERARAGAADPTLFPPPPAVPPVVLPRALPVSAIVTYAGCPKRFYWSYVRPLPRRPSAAARLGTLVHSWIERHGAGQIALYDPDELEDGPRDSRAAELKQAFLASRFAGRTPVLQERSFSLVVGGFIIQGRVDAVFADEDGRWEIVDWKSGRAPETDGAERWQLDLYALAAQEIWGRRPEDLTVTFVYLGEGVVERSAPARPAAEIRRDLGEALAGIADERFEPVPGPACAHCDFLRDCEPGTAFRRGPR